MRLSLLLAGAAAFGLVGCQASLQPLKTTEPPSSLSSLPSLKKKIPLPIVINVDAPDSMPSWGGKHTYPVKHYVEKAFQDASQTAFAQLGTPGDYAYVLDIQALSSQLKDTTPFGSNNRTASFETELNTILRDPEGKILQNKNFSTSAETPFDDINVPDAVWQVVYQLAGEFVGAVRAAPWLRGALTPKAPAGANQAQIQAMIDAAVKNQRPSKEEAAAPEIHSDVDNPKYKLPENPDNYALVIGIEKYLNGLPVADFAERDAEAMRQHLIALGYPERNIITLKGDQAVRSSMQKYIETWLPKNVNENSRVFFYFSGHGAPDTKSGASYLVPWDGDAKFLDDTAYPVKRLYEKLNALPAKDVVVAMDSCFSGAGGRSVIPKGARPLVTHVDEGGIPSGKLMIFAAANGDEITGTSPSQGHGLFTYYFLKGLNEKGGKTTIKGLYDYLAPSVSTEARRDNRDQTPQLLPASLGAMADRTLK